MPTIPAPDNVPTNRARATRHRRTRADEQATIKSGGFFPSLAFGELQSPVTAGAITDVVTNFMNSNEDAKEGVRKLAAAAKVK